MKASNVARVALLAVGAAGTGLVAGILALWANLATLPRTDLAYGVSPLGALHDPFVRAVWVPVTVVASALGFAFAVWALWNVRLAKAGPVTAFATVIVAVLVAVVNPLLSAFVALIAAVATMLYCRNRSEWAQPPTSGASREGHAA
jgi:hypothetical protein